ncbi:membrane protein of unknown function [Pseudodesulfovibrio piezophilus C1TLV30]|uniref:CAAX prenyl protease 2/Lysostaphin resistance protein A-like domain-containing protein n=1 Tax=Pseudodesulfovibrio piezophilus (strain DSM 21447 / JCM 15486 / C1TLV30) TaxID=1322246 RepID=M1WKD5_PSEP2|nr:membrane protein of unknown function [Pseudodesulfovibrio piezophilus C1TLV30]
MDVDEIGSEALSCIFPAVIPPKYAKPTVGASLAHRHTQVMQRTNVSVYCHCMKWKSLLWLEFLTLFGALPLAYALGLIPLPRIPILLVIFAASLIYLVRHPDFNHRELIHGLRGHSREIRNIFIRSGCVAVICMAAVLMIDPYLLFGFPRSRPLLWLGVMLLYPLLSAYPQEIIYRAFLFTRYKSILPSSSVILWASTLAFAFLHIVFANWLAVAFTLPAGYIFTRTYVRTESLLLTSMEHALYGCIVFTSGLGRFFYTPS